MGNKNKLLNWIHIHEESEWQQSCQTYNELIELVLYCIVVLHSITVHVQTTTTPPPAIYLEHKNWGWSLYLMMMNTLLFIMSASCHSMKCREETEQRTVIKSATFLRLVHVPLLLAGWCCFNFNASSKSQSAIGHGITRSLTGTHTHTTRERGKRKLIFCLSHLISFFRWLFIFVVVSFILLRGEWECQKFYRDSFLTQL